ncbi:MAG TPA: sugar ABC transporter permease [Ktedonobacter sp.]|jgi:multiple sugar transport system permease protein|nr:sugar ABC transporter permease [Ktedonobacter sp.]
MRQFALSQPTGDKTHRTRHWAGKGLQYVINILLVFAFIFPLLFMVSASLKPSNDAIFSDMQSIRGILPVGALTLNNYVAVFQVSPFFRFLLNSIFISAVSVVLGVFFNSLAAFALSRLKWKGRSLVLTLIIATLIIPFETIAIPLLLLVNNLPNVIISGSGLALTQGWFDTYQVQIIPFITSAFSIFLFYQFFRGIPVELDEAALVDGASYFQLYWRIIMPNAGPVTATVAIFTFLGSWNSFLWPNMVIQSESVRPIMVGMSYAFQQNTQWGVVMAYATLVTLPVLAFFLAFQKAFVASLAGSAIKG